MLDERGGTLSPWRYMPAYVRLLAASALRTPISITSSYAAPFAMMSHHEMNGSLTSPSAYAGLHNIPPQMSAAAAAAAAAYGRSPMVSFGAVRRPFGSFLWGVGGGAGKGVGGELEWVRETLPMCRGCPLGPVTRQLPWGRVFMRNQRRTLLGVTDLVPTPRPFVTMGPQPTEPPWAAPLHLGSGLSPVFPGSLGWEIPR